MPGKRLLGIALAVACFPAILPLHGQAPSAGRPDRVRGRDAASRRIIVKFQPSATPSDIAQIERLIDADLNVGIGGIRARVLHSRSRHTAELEAMLAALPQLEYVEPDWVVHSTAIPNDLLFPDQWALRNVSQSVVGRAPGTPGADIHAAAAWDLTTGSREVVIGIVDTGLDYTHPDIAANVWTAPADFSFVIGDRIFTCPA